MKLRNRLNRIEKVVEQIKVERDDSELVRVGVWFADPSTGAIIPNSGSCVRVPAGEAGRHGVLLTEPPASRQEWPEVARAVDEFQSQLRQESDLRRPRFGRKDIPAQSGA